VRSTSLRDDNALPTSSSKYRLPTADTAPGSEDEAASGTCFTFRGLGSTESDK
jgi:hypothetical protein